MKKILLLLTIISVVLFSCAEATDNNENNTGTNNQETNNTGDNNNQGGHVNKSSYTVNFYAGEVSWDTVYVFSWDDYNKNKAWPGELMSANGDGWYSATVNYPNIIFNNGNNGPQTSNLKSQNGYFVPKNSDGKLNGTWYSSKPNIGIQEDLFSDSIYGEWIDEETNLVYTINENGSYSITQNDILLEDGSFDEEDEEAESRARKTNKKKITQKSKKSGGAKKTTTKPKTTKKTVSKSTTTGKVSVGNTSLTSKKTSSSSSTSKLKTINIYVQSDKIPTVKYYDNCDFYTDIKTLKVKTTSSKKKIGSIYYRWYKYTVTKSPGIYYIIERNGQYMWEGRTTEIHNAHDYQGNLTYSKPSGARSDIDTEDDYDGRDNLYYIRGNFEAEGDLWSATDGFNNMEEIEENIFRGTLYLPENIYGFKIGTADWSHDYSMPSDVGFVPKNEWFNVIKCIASEAFEKNAALSTSSGMYTFILDITDEENPQMMISSDEDNYEISEEDIALYIFGDFNNWKFDTENGMMTQTDVGTYEATINVTTTGLCAFKIADKALGGINDDIGFSSLWYNPDVDGLAEISLDTPTSVDGAYTSNPKGSTKNININFTETGSYKVNLVKEIDYYTLTVSKVY